MTGMGSEVLIVEGKVREGSMGYSIVYKNIALQEEGIDERLMLR